MEPSATPDELGRRPGMRSAARAQEQPAPSTAAADRAGGGPGRIGRRLPALLVAAVILAVWQGVTSLGVFPAYVFPAPLQVALVPLTLLRPLLLSTLASIYHLTVSYLLAVAVGLPLGVLLGASERARTAVLPLIRFLYPIPGIAWVPIAILWFGLGDRSIIFTVFISCVFPLAINTVIGINAIDNQYVRVMRMFRTPPGVAYRRVLIPGALPFILAGLRLSYGVGWRVLIGAEIIGSGSGLGFFIDNARWQLRSDEVVAGMILIGLLGMIVENTLFDRLDRLTLGRWGMGRAER